MNVCLSIFLFDVNVYNVKFLVSTNYSVEKNLGNNVI